MSTNDVRYLLFDIESVADGQLIADVRYAGQNLSPAEAIEKYRNELIERTGNEFIPYTFHVPIAIAIIKIQHDLRINDVVTLDEGSYRPHILTKHFWDGWRAYNMPTFISFNGRTFDIPLMELSAYRFGLPIPDWFNLNERTYDQRRNRYNNQAHLDMQEILTNYGATRFNGGLNLAANILGKPGKMGIAGHMVQDLYDQGELKQISDYCRCDVLDTYFVFLRTQVLVGSLGLDDEDTLVREAHQWLEARSADLHVYAEYLEACRPWKNPWLENEAVASGESTATSSDDSSTSNSSGNEQPGRVTEAEPGQPDPAPGATQADDGSIGNADIVPSPHPSRSNADELGDGKSAITTDN